MIAAMVMTVFLAMAQAAGSEPNEVSQLIVQAPVMPAHDADDRLATADSAANAHSDRVACREEVRANSRFTRRVCRKMKDWNRTSKSAQADFGSIQGRNNSQDGEKEGVYGGP